MVTKVKWSGVAQCVSKTCALQMAFHLMKLSNLSLTGLSYNYCYLNFQNFPEFLPPVFAPLYFLPLRHPSFPLSHKITDMLVFVFFDVK